MVGYVEGVFVVVGSCFGFWMFFVCLIVGLGLLVLMWGLDVLFVFCIILGWLMMGCVMFDFMCEFFFFGYMVRIVD